MATVEAAIQALTASLTALPSTPVPTWSTDEPRSSSRGRARARTSSEPATSQTSSSEAGAVPGWPDWARAKDSTALDQARRAASS
jgi:hypothetical protein